MKLEAKTIGGPKLSAGKSESMMMTKIYPALVCAFEQGDHGNSFIGAKSANRPGA